MYVYIACNVHQYVTSVQYYYLTYAIESFFRILQYSINYLYILSDIFYIFDIYLFLLYISCDILLKIVNYILLRLMSYVFIGFK